MIWGIMLLLTTIWVYQTALKEKTENMLYWVAGCALVFLKAVLKALKAYFYLHFLS